MGSLEARLLLALWFGSAFIVGFARLQDRSRIVEMLHADTFIQLAPLMALALPAVLVGQDNEVGAPSSWHLAGVSATAAVRTAALAAAVVITGALAVTMAEDRFLSSSFYPASWTKTIAVLPLFVAAGTFIGTRIASRFTAGVTVLVVALGSVVLEAGATVFGYLRWVYLLTPFGVLDAVTDPGSITLPAEWFRTIGVLVTSLGCGAAAWVGARGVLGRSISGRRRGATTRRPAWWWAAAAVGAFAWGYAVPALATDEVPWRVTAAWVADQANDVGPNDIAEKFLAKVQAGDLEGAGALSETGDARVAAGLLLPQVQQAGRYRATVDFDAPEPGQVMLRDSAGTSEPTMCLRRIDGHWLVHSLQRGPCET